MTLARSITLLALVVAACGGRPDAPYGVCRSQANCAEATPICAAFRNNVTNLSVSLCAVECTTSADCPDRGTCVQIVAGAYRALCMQRCRVSSDCTFPGGFCATTPAGDMACVP